MSSSFHMDSVGDHRQEESNGRTKVQQHVMCGLEETKFETKRPKTSTAVLKAKESESNVSRRSNTTMPCHAMTCSSNSALKRTTL